MTASAAPLVAPPPPACPDDGARGPTALADLVVEHVWEVLHGRAFRFLAATAVAFVVLFARAPTAWVNPMLFAEDRDWTTLLVTHGFWHTALHARPDYAVLGNVVVLWAGMRLCDLVAGGDPLQVARCQALVSYLAFAVVVSLPVALLHRRLRPGALVAVWLLALFMPLGIHSGSWSGYEILGRANNLGFAALFVAFLLVWVRVTAVPSPARFVAIDLGLVACVLTNPIASVVVPFAAWPALRSLAACRSSAALRAALRTIARDPATWSLAVCGLLCLAGNGIPTATARGVARPSAPPVPFDTAVGFGVARSLFYSLTWPVYRWLDTDRTLIFAAITLWLTWRYGLPRHRLLYAGGLGLLAVTSATLVLRRPELAHFVADPRTTFPDRYFYAQYLLGLPLMAAFAGDVATRLAARPVLRHLPLAALYGLALLAICREPPWKVSDSQFIVVDDGCFERAATRAVARGAFRGADRKAAPDGPYIGIPTHPTFGTEVLFPRAAVEHAVARVAAEGRGGAAPIAAGPAGAPLR